MATIIGDKEAFLSSKTGEFVYRDHDKTDVSQLRTSDDGTVIYTDKKTHTVKKGETLSVIAKKHGLSINELKKQNKLKSSNLSIGQVLKIEKKYVVESSKPVVKQEEGKIIARLAPGQMPGGITPPDLPPDAMPGNTINLVTDDVKPQIADDPKEDTPKVDISEDGIITHTVKGGETLFSIARKYKVSIDDVKKENNLALNNLSTGQKLRIKVYNPAMFKQKQDAIQPTSVEAEDTMEEETAQEEEIKENVENTEEIDPVVPDSKPEANNELKDKAQDKKEKVIDGLIEKYADKGSATKPRIHTVIKGETLWAISKKYNISITDLIELNGLKSNNLSIGQELKVK